MANGKGTDLPSTSADAEALVTRIIESGLLSVDFLEKQVEAMQEETHVTLNAAARVGDEGKRELSPERVWLGQFKARFDSLPQLHEGVQWTDVEKSLKAYPESTAKLRALDAKGHNINVFGEENGEFVFASAWNTYGQVSLDHRNIVFDKPAQEYLTKHFPSQKCNGNATDIVLSIGADLADQELHEQLRKVIAVSGWAWLRTDAATKKTGSALCGYGDGVNGYDADNHDAGGSFRAALRVKKV